MPYKRKESPFYQVRRWNLVGFGDTGQISTGVKNKRVAERMERTLDELAERALVEPSYRGLVEAVLDRRLDLASLQAHVSAGTLDGLRVGLQDPPLADAVDALRTSGVEPGVALGLDLLTQLAPPRARLSLLRQSRQVLSLLRRAEAGEPAGADGSLQPRKRNSVRRTLHRAVSLLLREHVGRAERDRVFAEVDFPSNDDTREVLLSPEEIDRLLMAAAELGYREARVFIWLALVTSADRGVLLAGERYRGGPAPGLRCRQLQIFAEDDGAYSGEVYLDDTKAKGRRRTVPLTDALCRELLPMASGKKPDEPVFGLGYQQVSNQWNRIRERAELPTLRIKDLRAQTAIYGERAGVPQTVMSAALGHSDEAMTRRYARHRAVISADQVGAIEREMGLTG